MDLRAAIRVRRTGAISWRQALTVLCGMAVVTAMIGVAEIAQRSAQRHHHVQVLVLRVGTASQQIATLAWQGIAQTQSPGRRIAPAVIRHGLAIWGDVNAAFTAMRRADNSPSTLALTRDVSTLYREGTTLMTLAQSRRASKTLPPSFQGVLARLSADAQTAAAVQQHASEQASSRAQIAELGSLAFGLLLLALLGLRLHRLRRAAGLTEAGRALERRSEQRIRALVEHSSDIITVVERDLTVRWQSPSVKRVLGYAPEDLLGRSLGGLVHPDDVLLVEGHVTAADEPQTSTFIARFRSASGDWRHLEAVVENRICDPLVQGVILSLRDISERQALEQELRHQAFHDALTGLANRALFEDRLAHALAGARRHDRPIGVLFLDLDDFKTINDSLGHAAGDELLRTVARRIAAEVRVTDTAARLGGDEFAVLLESMDEDTDADAIAARLLEAMRAPIHVGERELRVSASVGLARSDGATGVADLLRNADTAMYAAKAAGKGMAQTFEAGMHQRVLDRLELTGELQRALERDQFELDYQPIVELETGHIVGLEALVRWAHPERGRLAPGAFISLAEETGMIVALGGWVLHIACAQAAAWQREFPQRALYINVNVSPRQLHDPEFPALVAAVLRDSGLPGTQLVLEITENVLPDENQEMIDQLLALKALGVRVAVDDFGSGYSALSRLQAYPVDILKIDRSFIDGLGNDASKGQLVQGIVNLGESLHLEIVAEGIEEREQADQLREMRSPLGQGFLYSRPIAAEQIGALLRAGRSLDEPAVAPSA
jgi:diguanylate cyclase (GGDEF)-like protein/PAS domain S-box-containing protein